MRQFGKYVRRNHLALLALFIAIGGTSYAAVKLPNNSVGAKQIASGAVRSAEVKDHSLLGKDFAAGQLPAGAAGTTGPTGPGGATGAVTLDGLPAVPYARVRLRFTDRTISSSTPTNVIFDQVTDDNAGIADLNSHPSYLVVPRDGVYLLSAVMEWSSVASSGRLGGSITVASATGSQDFNRGVSASDISAGTSQFIMQPMSTVERLSAGQRIGLQVYQTNTGNQTLSSVDYGSFLEVTYLGR